MKLKSTSVWLIVGALILAAVIFRDTLGVLVTTAIFWALMLASLFVLPAVIGAVAGCATGDVVRWVRHWQHRRWVRRYGRRAV